VPNQNNAAPNLQEINAALGDIQIRGERLPAAVLAFSAAEAPVRYSSSGVVQRGTALERNTPACS
jgi:hypothetical protein